MLILRGEEDEDSGLAIDPNNKVIMEARQKLAEIKNRL